ncbi:MAG: DNA repair protein RadC [Oscillospiraceae bacterium]
MGEGSTEHQGHRRRMKQKFMESGLDSFHDHEVLELLLFYTIPQRNVNSLAHALLDRFGTLAGVLDAPAAELLKLDGMGEHTVSLLKLLPAVMARYLRSQGDSAGCVESTWQAQTILAPYFFGVREEKVYLLCLDAKRKLLAVRSVGEGSINAVAITQRKVMSEALAVQATTVVLAHNHPSGIALPSSEDIATTVLLQKTLAAVSIALWDHFIFADDDMVSLRESGQLPEPPK